MLDCGHVPIRCMLGSNTNLLYVQDIHASLTTVREALEFSARLRLATSVLPSQRAAFVDEVMRLLELDKIASRLVSSLGELIFSAKRPLTSGGRSVQVGILGATDALAPGERKRLTIAVELCANTPVIFLDEPTSGKEAPGIVSLDYFVRLLT